MARAAKTDYLQNFRFHVIVRDGAEGLKPTPAERAVDTAGVAGFQSCTLPELTVEATEYREGTFKYLKKFSGLPTVSDCTLMRGVVARDTIFFEWAMAAVSGAEYRSDLTIQQYARTQSKNQVNPAEPVDLEPVASREYWCNECLPIRCKPGADLDATSGEVSMQEVDFAMEWFEIRTVEPPDGGAVSAVSSSTLGV